MGFGPCARAPAATLGPTGVTECDAYADRYESCLEKLPADERDVRAAAAESQRKVFKDEAARPGVRQNLATSCAAALAAVKGCP